MAILLSGLVIFFGIHAVPLFPGFKASLQSRFGAMRFKGIYSLIALSGFALILLGMSRAEFRPVFTPPAWSPLIANLAMPVAFSLLVAAYVPLPMDALVLVTGFAAFWTVRYFHAGLFGVPVVL